MKSIFQKILGLLFLTMTMSSCSDNNKINSSKEYGQYLTMKMDGTMWKTDDSFEVKFVEQGLGIDENAHSYTLLLSVIQPGGRDVFQIVLRLPLDRIDNPLGSYPIPSDALQLEMMSGTAEIQYQNMIAPEIIFSTLTDPKGSPHVGTLTITEFEKGDGTFAQRQFNWLKGTFSTTLKATEQGYKTGEIIEIMGGEFEMPNAILQLGK